MQSSSPLPSNARRGRVLALVLTLAGAAPLAGAAACGANADSSTFTTSTGPGGTSTSAGEGGGASTGTGAGGDIFTDGGLEGFEVAPTSPVLVVELPPVGASTQQFSCINKATNQPVPGATWSVPTPELGTIDANGLFTANGASGGQVEVTCAVGAASAKTTLTVQIHALENPGGLTAAQQAALGGGPGSVDPSFSMLYPYDQTVFPRGILAPEVHLSAGSAPADVYYLHITLVGFEYQGYFLVSAATPQLKMSEVVWDALGKTAQGKKAAVEVAKLSSGQKYGPIAREWTLANGKLHGTIYYNTYDSPLAGNTGAMMRIKGTSTAPEVLIGNCTVCHSVSSDGSTAAAANHSGPGGTFDLTGGNVNPPNLWQTPELAAFAALYPKNGEVLVINGAPGNSYPPNTPGTSGPWPSSLYTKNGTLIPSSGIESKYAMSPVFSHDGTMLAFTDRSAMQQNGFWPSGLALFSYDAVTQKFSGYQVLSVPAGGRHLSWPAFTPDNKYVVFQDGTGEDLATWSGNTARLFAVNVQTKVVIELASLNGDAYVPQGARDQNKNYEPTIAPIASGGYFWVMFTSRRTYGNKLTGSPDQTKRLWVSAIDVNAQDGIDATHPAFYISGQELTSGNSRGFWALDPCKADGDGCETGDECCNGFCNPQGNPPMLVCAPPDGMCSDEFESCTTAADCCDPSLSCIGGKCSILPPPR